MNTPFPVRHERKLTVQEFLAFIEPRPAEERWQLIDGEAISLPRPTLVHQRIASNLTYALESHFRARGQPLSACFRVGLTVPGAGLFRPQGQAAQSAAQSRDLV
jgi:Uma2 family endonuclease